MSAFDVVVQDGDPRVIYSPPDDWESSANVVYSGGTLRMTNHGSASITFTFSGNYSGTQFAYYGDLHPEHGRFNITIDGRLATISSSYSPIRLDTQSLYSTTVGPGSHTVQIANLDDGKYLVLDYLTYLPVVHEPLNRQDITIEADSKQVSYTPADAWEATSTPEVQVGAYMRTSRVNASATFVFSALNDSLGTHIWYYADMGSDHGAFTIAVDGSPESGTFSSFQRESQPVDVLFSQALSPGQHVIELRNAESKIMGLGRFVYRPLPHSNASLSGSGPSVAQGTSTTSTHSISTAPSSSTTESSATKLGPATSPSESASPSTATDPIDVGKHSNSPSMAVIALIALTTAVTVIAAVVALLLLRRRRLQREKLRALESTPSPETASQHAEVTPYQLLPEYSETPSASNEAVSRQAGLPESSMQVSKVPLAVSRTTGEQ
ncbi:hypothetical protein EXIGLDRAFT_745586 [Exidia glandulosa HHB12029]|uniref:Uncharacterized protein n=1 Tax=Exidia glandulosa HHB12029 TaxID=1314781 RepID=A0A165NCM6_EXIGL|nr:hypothetical protein EXIGLDRAFT_745586 [Exidia glandulosa HHB12029]